MNVMFDDVVDSTARVREMQSRVFVVYDACNGNVVHVHRCLGDAEFVADDRAHSRMALHMAQDVGRGKELRVMPVSPNQNIQGEVTLRVDIKSGRITVTKAAPLSLADLVKRSKPAAKKKRVAVRKSPGKKAWR